MPVEAVGLFSGGLDSILASAAVRDAGVRVVAVNVHTPFTGLTRGRGTEAGAEKQAAVLGAEFIRVYSGEEYIEMLLNPRFGYGKNFNPCIDCKIHMLKIASGIASARGAGFIFTGDVLGQRPMSQQRQTIKKIDEAAGVQAMVLRPLSAKLLEETLPEKRGFIDREKLFAFSGRSRKPQMELASRMGIRDYPNASGGCLLTSVEFGRKVKDLASRGSFSIPEAELLKIGRHFRISPGFKLVAGRDEEENNRLRDFEALAAAVFYPVSGKGPLGLGFGGMEPGDEIISARIIARYVSGPDKNALIRVSGTGHESTVTAKKLSDGDLSGYRI